MQKSDDFVIIVVSCGQIPWLSLPADPCSFSRTSVCYVRNSYIWNYNNNHIKLHFFGELRGTKQVSVSLDISRLQRRMEKANTPSDSQENGESKDVNILFFQNSEIAHPGSHIYIKPRGKQS